MGIYNRLRKQLFTFVGAWKLEYKDDIKSYWVIPIISEDLGFDHINVLYEKGFRVTFQPEPNYPRGGEYSDIFLKEYIKEWYDGLTDRDIRKIKIYTLDDFDALIWYWRFILFDPVISDYIEIFERYYPNYEPDLMNRHRWTMNSGIATLTYLNFALGSDRSIKDIRGDFVDEDSLNMEISLKFMKQYREVKQRYMELSQPLIKPARS